MRKEDIEPSIIFLLVPVTGFGLREHFIFIRAPEKLRTLHSENVQAKIIALLRCRAMKLTYERAGIEATL